MSEPLPFQSTLDVKDRCLCLHVQRAARVLARRFDAALKPFGLTNGQFSLLMALNRPAPPRLSDLTGLLGSDRTTLTAALKVLEKQRLVASSSDHSDRRARRLALTEEGRARLAAALPVWQREHDALDAELAATSEADLRATLRAIAGL